MSATTTTVSKYHLVQGEIFYVMPWDTDPDEHNFSGGRPAVIVSQSLINECSGCVSVVYLTKNPNNVLPTTVRLNSTGVKSWAICEQVTTISNRQLGKYIGECTSQELKNILNALSIAYTFDPKKTTKELEPALNLWRTLLSSSKKKGMLSDWPLTDEDFNLAVPLPEEEEEEKAEVVPVVQPVEVVKEVVKEVSMPIESTPEYIRLLAERDTFKALYMEQQAQLIKMATA